MNIKLLFNIVLILLPSFTFALSISEVTSFIEPKKETVSVEVRNKSAAAILLNLSVRRIASPYSTEVMSGAAGQESELLFTPSRLLLSADGLSKVKFIYKGPADEQERYYLVRWEQSPLMAKRQVSTSEKKGAVLNKIALSTILTVKPRAEDFSYQFKDGLLLNDGNSSFEMTASGRCANKAAKDCKWSGPLAPGKSLDLNFIDLSDRPQIGVWRAGHLISVKAEAACKDNMDRLCGKS
ncbi:MAG: hypothetical protein ACRCU9_11270 [Iodobacter sp.]